MNLDDLLDLILFIGSLSAMAWGFGVELSPAWSAAIVGAIVASVVLIGRMRLMGKRKQPEVRADESA